MRYRKLGKTGWQVSVISMGCWGIGGQWGDISDDQSVATVHAAMDAGVNLFDTADSYGLGASEERLGHALKGRREGIYVATKVGNWARKQNDAPLLNSIHSVINCCHASLYRLGIETIDLYQCHIGVPERPELFIEAFELLKRHGKIRHYGISTNSLDAARAMNATGGCAACQINYSILARSAEADILPYCLQNDIGVLLRGPLAQGVLTDKFKADTQFSDSVREGWNDGAGRTAFLANLEKVAQLRPLVRAGRTMGDVALQFTLAHPAVTCPIPGMKSPAQARQNIAAAGGDLTADELALIDSIFPPQGPRRP